MRTTILTIRNRWPLIAMAAAVQVMGSMAALGWLACRAESEARRILSRQTLADNRRLAIPLTQALAQTNPQAKPATSPPSSSEIPEWRAAAQRLVEQIHPPNDGSLMVIHADSGELLCHPQMRSNSALKGARPGLAILHPLDADNGSAQLIINGKDAEGWAEMEGEARLVAVLDVPKLKLKVLAQQPEAAAIAPARAASRVVWGAGVPLAVLSSGLAALAALAAIASQERRLIRLISDLDRQVEERTRDLERNVRLLRVELFCKKRDEDNKLAANEKLNLSIQNVADYGIMTIDPSGRIITCNAGAKAISGYSGREMLGQSFSKLFAIKDRAQKRFKGLLREAVRGGRGEIQGWRERKDGSRYWVRSVIRAIRDADGQLIAYIEIARDVTSAKKRAESLRLLRQSMAQAPEGVLIVNSGRRGLPVVWANRSYQKLCRRSVQETIDRPLAQALGWGEELGAELRRALKDGLPESVEGRIVRGDGSSFRGAVSIAPIRDSTGRAHRWTIVISSMEPARGDEERAESRRSHRREADIEPSPASGLSR